MNDPTTADAPSDSPAPPTPPALSPAVTLKPPEPGAVEKAVAAIMTGLKNFGALPPEHPRSSMQLQGVLRPLSLFWEKYGTLSFTVEKQGLLFQRKSIYDGPASDDNPAFVLSRAGIGRCEFAPGLEEEELRTFFQLYGQYRVVTDEADDDLASALWRARLPHIVSEASCELWPEEETTLAVEALAAVAPEDQGAPEVTTRPGRGWEALRLDSSGDNYRKVSLALVPNVSASCALTQPEQEALLGLMAEDNQAGDSEAAVRLLFILLGRESEAAVYDAALGFLQEVYLNYLDSEAFQRAFFVLDHIRKEAGVARESKPWALPLYRKFYGAVLRPEIIDKLVATAPRFAELGAMEVKALGAILQQLPAQVAGRLIAQLEQVEVPEARSLFIEIILRHARRDREILVSGLNSEVEQLVLGIISIISEFKDRELVEQLLAKFRYDSRGSIRKESLRILASHNIY